MKIMSRPLSVTQNEKWSPVFPGNYSASGSFFVIQTPLASRAMSSRGKVDKQGLEQ